jgi:hypothetical protein
MMIFYHQLEEIAYRRQQEFLQQARRRRLLNTLQRQPTNHRRRSQQVAIWAGTQLIRWGLKLQGHYAASSGVATSNANHDFYGREPLI